MATISLIPALKEPGPSILGSRKKGLNVVFKEDVIKTLWFYDPDSIYVPLNEEEQKECQRLYDILAEAERQRSSIDDDSEDQYLELLDADDYYDDYYEEVEWEDYDEYEVEDEGSIDSYENYYQSSNPQDNNNTDNKSNNNDDNNDSGGKKDDTDIETTEAKQDDNKNSSSGTETTATHDDPKNQNSETPDSIQEQQEQPVPSNDDSKATTTTTENLVSTTASAEKKTQEQQESSSAATTKTIENTSETVENNSNNNNNINDSPKGKKNKKKIEGRRRKQTQPRQRSSQRSMQVHVHSANQPGNTHRPKVVRNNSDDDFLDFDLDDKSIGWVQPAWTKKLTLRSSDKGSALRKSEGGVSNLAKPITFCEKDEDRDINKVANRNVLRSTEAGTKALSGKGLSKPITHLTRTLTDKEERLKWEKPDWTKKKTLRSTSQDGIGHSSDDDDKVKWEKPDWTKKKPLRSTSGSMKDARPGSDDEKIKWEKPDWTKKKTLRSTEKGKMLKKQGDLARPITFPNGKE